MVTVILSVICYTVGVVSCYFCLKHTGQLAENCANSRKDEKDEKDVDNSAE